MRSITNNVSVPKGNSIRMMYSGTSIMLNTSLWDPHFAIPTAVPTLRAVEQGTYMTDRDIGEFFINFVISGEVRPFCGVGVTNFIT